MTSTRLPALTLEAPDSVDLADRAGSHFGLYVHIPFCSQKCGYCDFASFDGIEGLKNPYIEALVTEMRNANINSADTAFIGGGTPTVLAPFDLARIIQMLPVAAGGEITVEANPESLDDEMAHAIAAAGANRVSIGMQSSTPGVLSTLDRHHTRESVSSAVAAARGAGIERVNLDLIYGTPGESEADWEASLNAAVELDPGHISAYALTVERGTPLASTITNGLIPAPDDDDQAEKMEIADNLLAGAGYIRYEVSAWAKAGEACLHNLIYWACGEYRGFGSAAHSHIGDRRFWNASRPAAYIANPRTAGDETIDAATARFDTISLGMRRAAGLPLAIVGDVSDLIHANLLTVSDGRVRPTTRGFALGADLSTRLLSLSDADC